MPVRQVEIPKPAGGVRKPGIPASLDRLIQQAVLQVLNPIFDPEFSPHSFGFRPGRRAWDAVVAARYYAVQGYEWVCDLDISQFFGRVNHDLLMARYPSGTGRLGAASDAGLRPENLETGTHTIP